MTGVRVRGARFASLVLGLLLLACGDPGHGPARLVFDRDACEHCGMVITDRSFAAQVRIGRTPHRFDDLGCALEWVDEQAGGGEPDELWVMDPATQQWIDARKASFRGGQRTPMGYGFGAQPSGAAEAPDSPAGLTLDEVRAAIREQRAGRSRGGR